jgi:hypothetical protein
MLIKIFLTIFLALGLVGPALATSCTPFKHDYFVRCDVKGCEAAFGVKEVSAFKACERRPVVERIDPRVGAYIIKLVVEMHTASARGQYRLSLVGERWRPPNPDPFEGFLEELEGTLPRDGNGDACKVQEMPTSEIASLLRKQDARNVLTQISKDDSAQGAAALRDALESEALSQHAWSIARQVGYWTSSVLVLFVLIHSMHVFFVRLYRPKPHDRKMAMLWPVGLQLGVLGVGVGVAVSTPNDLWPGTLLVPAAVLILLGEGWAKLLVARSRATE